MKFILLGLIQGITEFLPISSSAHLYILKNYLNLNQNLLPFFISLHLATLLSIFVFFHKEIISSLFRKSALTQLTVITLITAVFGLTIDYFLKDVLENKFFISLFLLINGGIILSLRNISQTKNIVEINLKDSLLLGILQGLAVFPGISRSGITIAGLLKKGFKIKDAFSFSFLMAIPAILGAFLLKIKDLSAANISIYNMAAGFITAFILGLLALFIVKKTLINRKFKYFGYYCIIVSVLALLI